MPKATDQTDSSDQHYPIDSVNLPQIIESDTQPTAPLGPFPIVGIGCSAGGLDALAAFFSRVPESCGVAFVVVQHLDPNHQSYLPELLQRSCKLQVVEVLQNVVLEPNCVYVIPSGKDLSINMGALHLLPPAAARGFRLPIDLFLSSLAAECGNYAIGVILSGMGTDGAQGLGAIRDKGGLTLVQLPSSAQSDSMPRTAIEAGIVDYIDVPEALPNYIWAHHKQLKARVDLQLLNINVSQSELEQIIDLLRTRSGHDFSNYKGNTLNRRLERRLALHQLPSMEAYLRYINTNPQELDLLFKELLIGVTTFFRDPTVWAFLQSIALPALLARYPNGKALRAWIPACSTGEEAYTLAISFKEVLSQLKPDGLFTLQIYATDLDTDAIDRARKGFYPTQIAEQLSEDRLTRYFNAEEGGYRIGKEIRDMVIFAPHNIISDPPFTKLDLISCRNLLIYFDVQLQLKLLPLFHYSLNDGGLLTLGNSESIGSFTNLFMPLDQRSRVFLRLSGTLPASLLSFPAKTSTTYTASLLPSLHERHDSIETLTDQLIQQNYAPPAVLVNAAGDILYISGRTGKYLEPAAGKVNMNIHAMAREGLREALTGVIRNALQQTKPILLKGLQINTEDQHCTINVTVRAIEQPERLRGRVLIVFYDIPLPIEPVVGDGGATSGHEQLLATELAQTRSALQQTHAEMQTALEEYSVAYEVLQSTNEELQSTNEELTTSKEELQSLNEEMQTVNHELQATVDELRWVRNDMTNLLNSTEIATVFLDSQMKLRRFTTHATQLFKLIPRDVGRPLSDIVSELNDYEQLLADAIEVLRSLVFQEKQVTTKDGHWYRVRIMPYRTLENVIDGVVITFIDIAEVKQLEAALKRLEPEKGNGERNHFQHT